MVTLIQQVIRGVKCGKQGENYMKNIAILTCNKMTYKCSGIGCFDAFNNRTKAFERYGDEDIVLRTFFHCNGCDKDFAEENHYKLEQLKKRNVTIIHMALCIDVECYRYNEIKQHIISKGFQVVEGTH